MEESWKLATTHLPPGFRFHPTDQELLIHYLGKKIAATLPPASSIFAEVDLYSHNPWELPELAFFGEGEWFFFTPRERKYPNGDRPNRATGSGYWKATGTDKQILCAGGGQCIGVKKALVFYEGRPPKGTKTDWVMTEYRLLDATISSQSPKHRGSMRLDNWVLCRVRKKGRIQPPENNESSETWSLSPPLFSRSHYPDVKQQKQQLLQVQVEKSNISLVYQQPGKSEEAESGVESSTGGSGGRDSGRLGAQQLHEINGEKKMNLRFDDHDELILLQPRKRLQFSPHQSDSDDDQDFLAYLNQDVLHF